ncbi:MAG TPA: FG-GAP-like repeat-containing protein [Ignavibacteria bacterium]|nr:FG-GAP-like repeat-containing protein [Ignavibacteria bacterium]
MKLANLFFFFLVFSVNAFSQPVYLQKYSGIPFSVNGQSSMNPFNSGVDNAKIQFVDINADGLVDMFTFDKDTTLYFYQNTGSTSVPKFTLTTQRFQNLTFKNWFYFIDMDSDGDLDLFTGGDLQTMMFFRNNGSPTNPDFQLINNQIRTNSDTVILSEANCVPTFCDINNDGLIDFFTGSSLGTITFYQNIGTQNNFSFKFITDFWEEILILSPVLAANSESKPPFIKNLMNTDNERHGANSIDFVDIDGDGDKDLFFGDLFSKSIYYIKNNGTPSVPDMIVADSAYPRPNPYFSLGFNSVKFTDYNGDGRPDLFVTILYSAQTRKNLIYYNNIGPANNPQFQFVTDNFIYNVDVGSNSNLSFADFDGDGVKDLLIGSSDPRIEFYKNTGTNISPAFTHITDSISIQMGADNFYMAPAFGDLDADGDLDLILGSFISDSLWYYKNLGSSSSFNFIKQGRGNQFGITSVGQSSSPTLCDIDNDGDFDLFTGNFNGRIQFYENTGTPQNFNFVFRTNFYFNIDVGNESVPRFTDVDEDGDKDLLIGNVEGVVYYYKNIGSLSNPNFVLENSNYANVKVFSNAAPEFTDIDSDGDIDMFIGNIKGGFFYYENRTIIGITNFSSSVPEKFKLYQNYPNPFNPETKIKFDIQKNNSKVILKIFDISGKEISTLVNDFLISGTYEYTFKPNGLSSGVYFFRLIANEFSETKSMLLIK